MVPGPDPPRIVPSRKTRIEDQTTRVHSVHVVPKANADPTAIQYVPRLQARNTSSNRNGNRNFSRSLLISKRCIKSERLSIVEIANRLRLEKRDKNLEERRV